MRNRLLLALAAVFLLSGAAQAQFRVVKRHATFTVVNHVVPPTYVPAPVTVVPQPSVVAYPAYLPSTPVMGYYTPSLPFFSAGGVAAPICVSGNCPKR